jgi:uncharacterized protein (TIGR02996 family)
MTTEDDFQSALDATPEDWQTRLVFADWLEERGDLRAEGYRALGRLAKRSMLCKMNSPMTGVPAAGAFFIFGNATLNDASMLARWADCILPLDWYNLLPVAPENPVPRSTTWRYWTTRRKAEDDAAQAFASLPPERRAELLNSLPEANTPKKRKRKKRGAK